MYKTKMYRKLKMVKVVVLTKTSFKNCKKVHLRIRNFTGFQITSLFLLSITFNLLFSYGVCTLYDSSVIACL